MTTTAAAKPAVFDLDDAHRCGHPRLSVRVRAARP